ncbi:MAG: hypothetical protein JNG90_16315 [Planctomycetaceae bacterium]|nr:hypothetical protein [Planctomycetaceae bacterium]
MTIDYRRGFATLHVVHVLILYNAPTLAANHPDAASEAGVWESVEAFARALSPAEFDVELLGLTSTLEPLLQCAGGSRRPDAVVNFCEGFAGDPALEAHLAALLDLLGLPYTGASAETLWLTRDKARTKLLLAAAGLPAPAGWKILAREPLPRLADVRDRSTATGLGPGPWFVKPAAQDASLGIGPESVVTDWAQLAAQIESVRQRFGDVLVEPYLAGREFNVSVIDPLESPAAGEPRVLPLAEIQFADRGQPWPIVTYDAKWSPESRDWGATPVTCPADVEAELAERLREIARQAFRALACRDYARVDFRVDAAGHPWILEVNANPDLSPGAGFARSLQAGGIAYDEFARHLVRNTARRGAAGTR